MKPLQPLDYHQFSLKKTVWRIVWLVIAWFAIAAIFYSVLGLLSIWSGGGQ